MKVLKKRKGTCDILKELNIEMSDGFLVYAFIKRPKKDPIGHIHIFHGIAEHIGRYETAIDFFVEQGYVVSGHDHRGHGKTLDLNGIRGYFAEKNGFNLVVEDAKEVITELRSEDPALKFTLIGHSLGSFIARRYIQLYGDQVDAAVFSGTGDDQGIMRSIGKALAYVLGKKVGFDKENETLNSLVFGGFNKQISQPATEFDWLSENEDIVASYIADDYCGFVPTTQIYIDLFNGLGLIHQEKEIAKIPKELPILLFSGDADPVGDNGKSLWKVAQQYEDAHIEDVTVMYFNEGRHELLNDSRRPEVIQSVDSWIKKH